MSTDDATETVANLHHVITSTETLSLADQPESVFKKVPVFWTQNDETITLMMSFPGLKKYVVETDGVYAAAGRTTVRFTSIVPAGYGFEIKLLGKVRPVKPENYTLIGTSLKIVLTKLSIGLNWPYLTADNKKSPWLKMSSQDLSSHECDSAELGLNLGQRYVSCQLAADLKESKQQEEESMKQIHLLNLPSDDEDSGDTESTDDEVLDLHE